VSRFGVSEPRDAWSFKQHIGLLSPELQTRYEDELRAEVW
jgi:hypothetical protein